MSVARKVKIKDIDLGVMEQTAKAMGLSCFRNIGVKGYYSEDLANSKSDLVVKTKQMNGYGGYYSIGFRKTEEGMEIVADYHGGYVKRTLNELIPNYYERVLKAKIRGAQITRENVNGKVQLRLRR